MNDQQTAVIANQVQIYTSPQINDVLSTNEGNATKDILIFDLAKINSTILTKSIMIYCFSKLLMLVIPLSFLLGGLTNQDIGQSKSSFSQLMFDKATTVISVEIGIEICMMLISLIALHIDYTTKLRPTLPEFSIWRSNLFSFIKEHLLDLFSNIFLLILLLNHIQALYLAIYGFLHCTYLFLRKGIGQYFPFHLPFAFNLTTYTLKCLIFVIIDSSFQYSNFIIVIVPFSIYTALAFIGSSAFFYSGTNGACFPSLFKSRIESLENWPNLRDYGKFATSQTRFSLVLIGLLSTIVLSLIILIMTIISVTLLEKDNLNIKWFIIAILTYSLFLFIAYCLLYKYIKSIISLNLYSPVLLSLQKFKQADADLSKLLLEGLNSLVPTYLFKPKAQKNINHAILSSENNLALTMSQGIRDSQMQINRESAYDENVNILESNYNPNDADRAIQNSTANKNILDDKAKQILSGYISNCLPKYLKQKGPGLFKALSIGKSPLSKEDLGNNLKQKQKNNETLKKREKEIVVVNHRKTQSFTPQKNKLFNNNLGHHMKLSEEIIDYNKNFAKQNRFKENRVSYSKYNHKSVLSFERRDDSIFLIKKEIFEEDNKDSMIAISESLQIKDGEICFICCTNVIDSVIMDCGHSGACYTCTLKMWENEETCYICRGKIKEVLQVEINKNLKNVYKVVSATFCLETQNINQLNDLYKEALAKNGNDREMNVNISVIEEIEYEA